MVLRNWFVAFVVIAGCLYGLTLTGSPPGETKSAADASEPLEARAAKAHLELAKFNLEVLMRRNQAVAKSVALDSIQIMAIFVAEAEASYEAARQQQPLSDEAYLLPFKARVKAAQHNLDKAADRRLGIHSQVEWKRQQLELDLARARLEQAEALVKAPDAAKLALKIDVMGDWLLKLLTDVSLVREGG